MTKCDGIITNCDSFFITKCDTVYYKLRQVLQSAMIITNCDSTLAFRINIKYLRMNERFLRLFED